MRSAKIKDHWRTAYKRKYEIMVDSLSFDGLRGFENGSLAIRNGITALCGGNGVGKTTLLNAILAILSPDDYNTSKALKLEGCELFCKFISGSSIAHRLATVSSGVISVNSDAIDQLEVALIDPSVDCPKLTKTFSEITNLDELLDGIEPIVATREVLELLALVVGKDYLAAWTYEVELDNDGTIPYFQVRTREGTYGSESMGLGELSVHLFLWHLSRISANSIVLVEEPETFLSPRSQEKLVDIFAKFCAEKGMLFVLTSHSAQTLASIPSDNILVLSRSSGNVRLIESSDQISYLQALGVKPQVRGAILVEDRAAREFARLLLNRVDPSFACQYEIIDAGSNGAIIKALSFPRIKGYSICGLFDGDEYDKHGKLELRWPLTYLPWPEAPETHLRNAAIAGESKLAELVGDRDGNRVHLALSGLEGEDHHDWLENLKSRLGITYEQLLAYLFDVWFSNESNRAAAEATVCRLMERLQKQT